MPTRISGLALLAVVLAACGGDAATTTTQVTTTVAAESTSTSTTTTTVAATTSTSEATTTTTEVADPYLFEIGVEGSTVTGGGRISVPLGETVTLRITSDVTDQVHIHGYDLFLDLEAGVPAEISFAAEIPGVVEIETHHGGLVIANLESS